jgi:hypothetical protein
LKRCDKIDGTPTKDARAKANKTHIIIRVAKPSTARKRDGSNPPKNLRLLKLTKVFILPTKT